MADTSNAGPVETTETFTLNSRGGIDTCVTVYRENGELLTATFSPDIDPQHTVTLNSDEVEQFVAWWLRQRQPLISPF